MNFEYNKPIKCGTAQAWLGFASHFSQALSAPYRALGEQGAS